MKSALRENVLNVAKAWFLDKRFDAVPTLPSAMIAANALERTCDHLHIDPAEVPTDALPAAVNRLLLGLH